jgi:hypothetical protein
MHQVVHSYCLKLDKLDKTLHATLSSFRQSTGLVPGIKAVSILGILAPALNPTRQQQVPLILEPQNQALSNHLYVTSQRLWF